MSFSNHARLIRDASLPYGKRVSSLRSCVEQYRPIGFFATLSYLESVAGPFQRDEESLLRALEMLGTSRRLRYAAHLQYAARRRTEKRAGQRQPRKDDPDPATLGLWFGATRAAALHKLQHWSRTPQDGKFDLEVLRESSEPWAQEFLTLITACLESGGYLSLEQRSSLATLVPTLHEHASSDLYADDPLAYYAANRLRGIAWHLTVASDPSLPH